MSARVAPASQEDAEPPVKETVGPAGSPTLEAMGGRMARLERKLDRALGALDRLVATATFANPPTDERAVPPMRSPNTVAAGPLVVESPMAHRRSTPKRKKSYKDNAAKLLLKNQSPEKHAHRSPSSKQATAEGQAPTFQTNLQANWIASSFKRSYKSRERKMSQLVGKLMGGEGKAQKRGPQVLMHENPWMINPTGSFRLLWDIAFVMPLLMYLTVMMPFRICFSNEPVMFSTMYWFEFCIEAIFVVDIFLNFRTGFVVEGITDESKLDETTEYHPSMVARHYVRGWFPLDVASGIPFALIDLIVREVTEAEDGGGGGGDEKQIFKMVKSLRLLRFFKLTKLLKLGDLATSVDRDTLDALEDFLEQGMTRSLLLVTTLALQLAFICHVASCLFVAVGRSGSLQDINNWLENEQKGPFVAEDTTGGDKVGTIYLAAFYFCITTMTSVGYGDIITRNNTERIYTIILEFVGGFTFAMIIASLTSVVTTSDMNSRQVSDRLDAVASFVNNREFPSALGRRIRRHFRQFYSKKSAIDEVKIFNEMSTTLRKDVSEYIVSVRMGDVKLFQSMNPKLWPKLFPLLNPTSFEPGELVCTQDDECNEMLIVLEGSAVGSTVLYYEDFLEDKKPLADSPTAKLDKSTDGSIGLGQISEGADDESDEEQTANTLRRPSGPLPPLKISPRAKEEPTSLTGEDGRAPDRSIQFIGPGLSEADKEVLIEKLGIDLDFDLDHKLKERHIGAGDSMNVLCALKIWNRCLETVVASNSASLEVYSVDADAFYQLFNHDNEIDAATFKELCRNEAMSFQMERFGPAPTPFGIPLYMKFSTVAVNVVACKGLIAADKHILTGRATSDPYVIVDLIDADSNRVIDSSWRHRTPVKHRTVDPRWTERASATWRDVHMPFAALALRVRVFDEDLLDEDDELGECILPITELDPAADGFKHPLCSDGRKEPRARLLASQAGALRGQSLLRKASVAMTFTRVVNSPEGSLRRSWTMSPGRSPGAQDEEKDEEAEPSEEREKQQMDEARQRGIVDVWHPLQPSELMLEKARKLGLEPPQCGQVRLRTWLKDSDGIGAPPNMGL